MDIDSYCNRFRFAWDMNGDLAFTVSDLMLLAKAVALLPTTVITSLLHRFEWSAVFFEVNCATGQGIGGAIASLILWPVIMGLLVAALSAGTPGR